MHARTDNNTFTLGTKKAIVSELSIAKSTRGEFVYVECEIVPTVVC